MGNNVVDAILRLSTLCVMLDEQLDLLDGYGLHYKLVLNDDPNVFGHFYLDLD